MASQLRINTSSLFQTSSVACTNFYGTSKKITFSVLGNNLFCMLNSEWCYSISLFLSLSPLSGSDPHLLSLPLLICIVQNTMQACSRPVPQDGIVIPIIQTSQRNDPIIFKCNDGYQPTEEFSTLCLQNGTWIINLNGICSGW